MIAGHSLEGSQRLPDGRALLVKTSNKRHRAVSLRPRDFFVFLGGCINVGVDFFTTIIATCTVLDSRIVPSRLTCYNQIY